MMEYSEIVDAYRYSNDCANDPLQDRLKLQRALRAAISRIQQMERVVHQEGDDDETTKENTP
jgi:hypothetical protein